MSEQKILYCCRGGLYSDQEVLRRVTAAFESEKEESSPSLSVEQFPEDALRVLEEEGFHFRSMLTPSFIFSFNSRFGRSISSI